MRNKLCPCKCCAVGNLDPKQTYESCNSSDSAYSDTRQFIKPFILKRIVISIFLLTIQRRTCVTRNVSLREMIEWRLILVEYVLSWTICEQVSRICCGIKKSEWIANIINNFMSQIERERSLSEVSPCTFTLKWNVWKGSYLFRFSASVWIQYGLYKESIVIKWRQMVKQK